MNYQKFSRRWAQLNFSKLEKLQECYIYDYDQIEKFSDQYFGFVGNLVDLRGFSLTRSVIDGAQLSYCDLSFSFFENVIFVNTSFDLSSLKFATFKNCKLIHCHFLDSHCAGVLFKGCHLESVNFNGAILTDSTLEDTVIGDANFMLTDCTGSNFKGVKLDGEVVFKSSKLPSFYRRFIESSVTDARFLERVRWV